MTLPVLRMTLPVLRMMPPVLRMMPPVLRMMLPVLRMMLPVLRMMLPVLRTLHRSAAAINRATEQWRSPVLFGFVAAAALWTIWFFTHPPCTMARAAAGDCHPGALARYINHEIMAQCLLVGMAAATLKGGYDQLMLNRERKRADEAEERVKLERQRLEDERKRTDERIDAMHAEMRAERQENRAALREERERNQAAQQEMLARIAENQSILTQMLQQRQNGDRDGGNGNDNDAPSAS